MAIMYMLVLCIYFAACIFGEVAPGPRGRMFDTSCRVDVPNGATMLADRVVLADGTEVPITPCNAAAPINTTDHKKREADGWNEYTYFYPAATSIDQFIGDWVVPQAPGTGWRGQTLFLFTALEPAGQDAIIQPVLQYGYSAANGGGGQAWFVAMWYVYNNNQAYATTQVQQVNPGQTLHTTMTRTGGAWNCNIYADGVLKAAVNFPDRDYNIAFNTLEVYGVRDCASFPYQTATTFSNLQVKQIGAGLFTPTWTGQINQGDCGQNVACPAPSVCTLYYGVPALLSPAVYNPDQYRAVNPDLASMDNGALQNHWLAYGTNEGRTALNSFAVGEYKAQYADLAPLPNQVAISHFATNGYLEGRAGRYVLNSLVFNYGYYMAKYPDLQAAFGNANDRLGAINHWVNSGINEGRQASPTFSAPAYLSFYPDLRAAFGPTNYYAATSHYVTNGHAEGRRGV